MQIPNRRIFFRAALRALLGKSAQVVNELPLPRADLTSMDPLVRRGLVYCAAPPQRAERNMLLELRRISGRHSSYA